MTVPISGKDLAKLFKKHGYKEIKGGGNKTITIPGHKELKKGLEKALRKHLKEDL